MGIPLYQLCQMPISIHAPREGGDVGGAGGADQLRDFNPRPPRGGRPGLLKEVP